MTQPPGFEVEGQEHKVCKLIKALYGLKQAPRAWYAKMDEYLKKVRFQQSESDDTLYVRQQGKYLVILVMYVDYLIITGNHDDLLHRNHETANGMQPKEFFDISKEQKIFVFFTQRLKILYLVDILMPTLLGVLMIEHQHQDLGISQEEATSLFIDSQSAIKLAKNPVFHSKTKHVDTKYHHIRSLIAKDVLKPVYCPSKIDLRQFHKKNPLAEKNLLSSEKLVSVVMYPLDHRGNLVIQK
eukprot:PITA_33865